LHDIGKGLPGDHSVVGEAIAKDALTAAGLASEDIDDVCFLGFVRAALDFLFEPVGVQGELLRQGRHLGGGEVEGSLGEGESRLVLAIGRGDGIEKRGPLGRVRGRLLGEAGAADLFLQK
jgi:hypothetical protein